MPPSNSASAATGTAMLPGTFAADDRLPRVPLPSLDDSCRRFLEWCSPLLTAEELSVTEQAVEQALEPGSPARVLHAALEAYDREPGVHSWLDQFWPSRYLGRRDRIALNANFFFLFAEKTYGDTDPFVGVPVQLRRAVDLISAAVLYKIRLDAEQLPPVIQRGQPLSMDQTKFLFSTTRIPGLDQDSVRAPYGDEHPGPSVARHIVVLFRGNMFRLDVLDAEGRPHSPTALAAGLTAIRTADVPAGSATSVGHLTTKARAAWATDRQRLMGLAPQNATALDAVETALFCLCLEDFAPNGHQEATDQLLHGDSGNRWFDKSVSLIVFENGTAGINVEHCELDGTTILGFVDALLGPAPQEQPPSSPGTPEVAPLQFHLDEEFLAEIAAAAASFAAYAADTATRAVTFSDFGADRAKQLGVSPDAFVQLAYQLAHRRAKGITGATYESIATRQYRRGRTEAMRVITPEIIRFVDAMQDPATDADVRRQAFSRAATAHVARAKECQAGQAPEQHLWELAFVQKRRGTELGVTEPLALYDTPGWRVMRDDYLSTSSAPSTSIEFFGFGSTSQTCIGIGYVLLPERFTVYLSTPRTVVDAMLRFADELAVALDEIEALLAPDSPTG